MMKNIFLNALVLLLAISSHPVGAQNSYPQDDFIPPVDFELALSGTFGELRSNHFHSGIDIKTQGVQGKALKAVADGFVSRIAVSPGGFGKAIYIEHPNGYTSVYGHCRNFTKKIDDFVRAEQYRKESYQINVFPEKDQFRVKQGEVIAYSGNTGGSMGPHLHFEIRETNGQVPVNPLLFDFPVKDFIRPKINRLMIYPFGNFSLVEGKNKPLELPLAGWGPVYRLKNPDTVRVSGKVYFGIETIDKLNAANNKNGIFSIAVFIDSVQVYAHKMEKFPFSESKYVNSLIDYSYYADRKKRIQKTYIEPGNKLSVYSNVSNNGIFEFTDNRSHTVVYNVRDARGNESVLTFYVKSDPSAFREVFENENHKNDGVIFKFDEENVFERDSIKLIIPKGALYDTMLFQFSEQVSDKFEYSKIYTIHNNSKPLHKSATLMIKPGNIDEAYREKYLIAGLDTRGDAIYPAGGKWNGDYLQAGISRFGNYIVAIDTTSPEINPVNISPGKNISGQTTIKIKIRDEFSGIKHFRATMNGKWILMEWDPKSALLKYTIDDRTINGKNQFRLTVTDGRNNETVYEAGLIR
jgi:hypothetical protein